MKATIICIGDELLIGQTINTNSSWMGQQLTANGITVASVLTIGDTEDAILSALDEALRQTEIVLVTGGLGPTSDDLTLPCLVKYFGSNRVFDEAVWENIRQIFHMRGREINEASKQLAYVPDNARIIYNSQGTAPGTIFMKEGRMVASMPGVPYEMKAMMERDVLPFVRSHFHLPHIINRHILTAGVGETQLAASLVDFEQTLPPHFNLAYLPNVGKVKLRISGSGEDVAQLKKESDELLEKAFKAVEQHVYGLDDDALEAAVGRLLTERGWKLALAESCTGGYIGHLITAVPGASAYFNGGIISYSNEVKMNVLNVSDETLKQFGAVSEETVREMLQGALQALNADVAIAVSGVAGPDGGTAEKPVGTVYIGVGSKDQQYIKRWSFTQHRERNIQLSGVVALVMLRKFMLKQLQA
jgi:nicotinamide-nucleotide amidase